MGLIDFYAEKCVFITGGTGFLGKIIIEKLLYSCEKIDKIYVLTRAASKSESKKRILQMTDLPLFNRLKKERPEELNKIIPVVGDIAAPNLGLNKNDEQILLEKISVVIHAAATVNFEEPLRVALNINVEGTKRLLSLCERMKNVISFVHVSTAFCNINKMVIDEIVYPPPATQEEVDNFLKHEGDENKLKELLNGRPNTYVFTKALAENVVASHGAHIPSAIVRPSMVKATQSEPFPGWVDTWSVPTFLLVGIATGLNRIIITDPQNVIDLIPADLVSNAVIVAATKCNSSKVSVFNCCSSDRNPITYKQTTESFSDEAAKHGFAELPYPRPMMLRSSLLIAVITYAQTVLLYLADIWLRITGNNPRFMKVYNRLIRIRDSVQFFTRHSYRMPCPNLCELASSLSPEDQKTFPCDPAGINWKHFMCIQVHAVKTYLMKKK